MRAKDFLKEEDKVESQIDDSSLDLDEEPLMIPATQQYLELVKAKIDPERAKKSPVLRQILSKKKSDNC